MLKLAITVENLEMGNRWLPEFSQLDGFIVVIIMLLSCNIKSDGLSVENRRLRNSRLPEGPRVSMASVSARRGIDDSKIVAYIGNLKSQINLKLYLSHN